MWMRGLGCAECAAAAATARSELAVSGVRSLRSLRRHRAITKRLQLHWKRKPGESQPTASASTPEHYLPLPTACRDSCGVP